MLLAAVLAAGNRSRFRLEHFTIDEISSVYMTISKGGSVVSCVWVSACAYRRKRLPSIFDRSS